MATEPSRRHTQEHAPPAADALTSLPAHLLDEILKRLDLGDAVRTSVLSRAWRFRWESLPVISLSFLDRPGTPTAVVDSILVRYAGRISRFSFEVDVLPRSFSIDHWLIALSRRGVQSIDLRIISRFSLGLHSSIFSCGQLVSLNLHRCRFPPLPSGFAGFPSLMELNLTDVRFVDNGEKQLEPIIRQSPLLEVLKLSAVEIPGDEWVIQAPNLRSLTIISEDYYGWQIGELPRLNDATIDLEAYVEEHDFGKFLAGLAHVSKLTISTGYDPYTGVNLLEVLPCTFDNLRSLFLSTHFIELHTILSTYILLRSAPNLTELEIEIDDNEEEQEFEANAEFQNTLWTDGSCAHLQVVKINGIGCLSNEMCFIELVLAKATVLQTMSISLGDVSKKSNEDALSELNTYRRASPHAQVFFKGIME